MADFYLTPTGAGLVDGSSWANAFNWANFAAWVAATANDNDNCYVLAGAYNANLNIATARDGGVAGHIRLIGVADEGLTPAEHGALPEWTFTAGNSCILDDYWEVRNIKMVSDDGSYTLRVDLYGRAINCNIKNTGAGDGIRLGNAYGVVENCIVEANTGEAIDFGQFSRIAYNLITSGGIGLRPSSSGCTIVGNLVYGCTTGLSIANYAITTVIGNTFYGCATGILGTTAVNCIFLNNILAGCITPANWTGGAVPTNYWDYNCWFNSATPLNVTKGPHAINADPQFVDAAGLDFRVRNEAVRNLLLHPITLGAVPGSIYEEGATGIAGSTAIDLSGDQLTIDGLEMVNLDGADIDNVKRWQDVVVEHEPTEGVYLDQNTRWRFPYGALLYAGGNVPTVGGLIIDADGNSYVILEVRQPKHSDFWGVVARGAVISTTYDLDDTVTWYPSEDFDIGSGRPPGVDAYGDRIVSHSTPDASFTDIPAKIMLRRSTGELLGGQADYLERYDIYVDGDIGQLHIGDLLKDQNSKGYEIVSYRNRDRLEELSVLECTIKQPR